MGVTGDVLARILRTAGRQVDLSGFAKGISDYAVTTDGQNKNSKRQKVVRPLRIGVDVSTWIARASHGHGGMLLDDRHLSNYGRAELLNRADGETNSFHLAQESVRKAFVSSCARYVVDKITKLKERTKADILIVLDGKTPPIKLEEVNLRKEKRRSAAKMRDAPANAGQSGKKRIQAAKRAGAGSAHAAIIAELTVALRTIQVPFLVAPYEADGQLAYLSCTGMIDLVITEDSDLLAYGIQSVLYKENESKGLLVQRRDLGATETLPKSLCLQDFSSAMMAVMFACVGCDYCNSLKGIGSVTAREIIQKVFKTNNSVPVLHRVFDELYRRSSEELSIEQKTEFERRFICSVFMYQHPPVFCPVKRRCVILGEISKEGKTIVEADEELAKYRPYAELCSRRDQQHAVIGDFPPEELQIYLAEGWLQPRTMQIFPGAETPPEVIAAVEKYQRDGAGKQHQLSKAVNLDCQTPGKARNGEFQAASETTSAASSLLPKRNQAPVKDSAAPPTSKSPVSEQQAGEDSAPSQSSASQETSNSKTSSSGSDAAQSGALITSSFPKTLLSKTPLSHLSTLQQPSLSSQLSSTQASSQPSSQPEVELSLPSQKPRLDPLIYESTQLSSVSLPPPQKLKLEPLEYESTQPSQEEGTRV